jgi:hypothetical protein
MLSSLSSTIITVFDMADLPKSTLFPAIRVRCRVVAGSETRDSGINGSGY